MNRAPLRRSMLAAILTMVVVMPAGVASAGILEDRLDATRSEAREAKAQLEVVDRRQQVLVRQITRLNGRVNELEGPLRDLETEVENLEYRITQRERRIAQLKRDRVRQERLIKRLERELRAARALLAHRVVAAYKTGDTGIIEQLASAESLEDLFAREEALGHVVGLDRDVVDRISGTERKVRIKRAQNFELRRRVRVDIQQLEVERREADARRAEAQRARDQVAAVRAQRDAMLKSLREREVALGNHLDDLEEDAKVLEDVIKNGTTAYHGQISGLSASGLIWPVSGPVVSPFGQRWGRLHAGIDIAIGAGNPIYAAAPGIVTYAGWMSGYGNMVIVQHAGALSTGYAHQSQIATSVGQLVSQGQLIGFVGCTGHCYGDHLHFETRIDGSPQDPMQYLS